MSGAIGTTKTSGGAIGTTKYTARGAIGTTKYGVAVQPPPTPAFTPEQVIANANRIFGEMSIADAFVVDFTAADVSGESNLTYFEDSPAAGVRNQFFPAEMYTDASIWWIERIRIVGSRFQIHRGGSSVQGGDMRSTLNSGNYGLYVINVSDGLWFANEANNNTGAGGGFILFTRDSPIHDTADFRDMGNKRVIVGLVPGLIYNPFP